MDISIVLFGCLTCELKRTQNSMWVNRQGVFIRNILSGFYQKCVISLGRIGMFFRSTSWCSKTKTFMLRLFESGVVMYVINSIY